MSANAAAATASADQPDIRVLDIGHLSVTFATDGGDVGAVKDVSLDVRAGEVLAIVGESGSGKTVTAKTILGLLPETASSSGTVLINGADVISVSAERLRQIRGRDVAMVFQEPSTALNPVFTVGWQIAEGIRAHSGRNGGKRVSAKEAKARAVEALRKVGIPDPDHRINYYPHQFSGGPGTQSGPDRCGRAHHRTGRHGAGRNPGTAPRPAGQVRHLHSADNPQHGRGGGPRRPRGGHVPGQRC
jgi:peptide/nickel transport system ATP-binding protein